MLLTLNISSLKPLIRPSRGSPKLSLLDAPRYTSDELGLSGLTLTTDLLAGATRDVLAGVRDQGDKSGCAVLALVEPDPQPITEVSEENAQAGVTRLIKVVEAASLLGCNSAVASIRGRDEDNAFERAIERLKPVVERAERLEINLLLAPTNGLTQAAERITELVKQVGGFRIGTMPDFEAAAQSGDAVTYLRRITPYASVVNASTLAFVEPEPLEASKAESGKKKAAKPDDDDPMAPDAELDAALGELAKSDPLAAALAGLGIDDAEAAAIDAEMDDVFDDRPPIHTEYALEPMLEAVAAVGFDGTLAIDYRGKGDCTLGVLQSREAIEAALEAIAENKGK